MSNESPSAEIIRHMILEKFTCPVVFHGFINDWEMLSWTLDTWSEKISDKSLPFRIGSRKATKYPQWESECGKVNLTLREFLNADSSADSDDGLSNRWLYFDYKDMHEWFADLLDINAVSWRNFGFPERKGSDSTVWIGNNGAHTPCHMDTYGSNLVAQIHGRKQWILFPPEKYSLLQPTRVPYEESSIYSNINLYSPDPAIGNVLQEAYVVTLNPGDVLFVPHHWWHYVENDGVAISINSWIPLPCDDDNRLQEALVRFVVSQVVKDLPEHQQVHLLNPNEVDLADSPCSATTEYIAVCRRKCKLNMGQERGEPMPKRLKSGPINGKHLFTAEEFLDKYKDSIKPVSKCTAAEFQRLLVEKRNRFEANDMHSAQMGDCNEICDIINAFCHPDIISRVKDMLLQ